MLINQQRNLKVFAEFVYVTVRASFGWKFSRSVNYAFREDVRLETAKFLAAMLLTIQLFWYTTLCLWAGGSRSFEKCFFDCLTLKMTAV